MIVNEREFDDILTNALYHAAELDYGDTLSGDELNPSVAPSAQFLRRIRILLRNPRRYIRNRRRPIYSRALRGVAAAVIAFALLLGSVMVISPTARAAVTNFVRSWFVDRVIYTPIGGECVGDFTFEHIPDGFETVHEMITDYQIFRVYNDGESYLFVTITAGTIILDNEHHDFYEAVINGHQVSIYAENTGEHLNNIVIFFEEQNTFIVLSSEIAVAELLKIAENIRY